MSKEAQAAGSEFSRSQLLLGSEAILKLKNASVAVFGLGGVGSAAAEALVRGGIGSLTFFDGDKVSVTNINRQRIAFHSTLGMPKAEVMRGMALDINPQCRVEAHVCFYTPENADSFDLSKYDYIIDAVDMVTAKIEIIVRAENAGTPVISCMGAGNKLDPTKFEVADIYKTSVCPLARVMRRELKARGIKKLKVVYSTEPPVKTNAKSSDSRAVPGSVSFVPPAAGLVLAGEVIKDIISRA